MSVISVDLMDSFDLMKRFTMQDVMSAALATDTFFMIRYDRPLSEKYWSTVRMLVKVTVFNVNYK